MADAVTKTTTRRSWEGGLVRVVGGRRFNRRSTRVLVDFG